MMQNGIVYQLRPLAPLTDVTEYSYWPTPLAQEREQSHKGNISLSKAVKLWPTPTVSSGGGQNMKSYFNQRHGLNLQGAVQMFPTPTANDIRHGSQAQMARYHLNDIVSVREQNNGPLNPAWVEWLMGFPAGWTELDASEMPSSHKSHNSLVYKSPRRRN
jgi:hypothetical protein